MSGTKVEEKLDLFLDRGLRYYLKRVFWSDFDIKKDLDAAGYLTEKANINKIIKNRPQINTGSSIDTGRQSYDALVVRMNNFKTRPETQEKLTSTMLEKDIKGYFNKKDLRIYKFVGEDYCRKEGYYLDTTKGRLMYYSKVPGTLHTIGSFDVKTPIIPGAKITKARELFPALFRPEGMFDSTTSRSVKLTPDLFRKMISHTYESNENIENLEFFVPANGKKTAEKFDAGRDFIEMSSLLEKRTKAVELSAKYTTGDERDRKQMVLDLIGKIQERSRDFLTDAYKYGNPSQQRKYNIMKAINEYLDDGDVAKFASAASTYDGGYFGIFKRMIFGTDEVDRSLAIVRNIQGSNFFAKALQEIKEDKASELASIETERAAELAKEYRAAQVFVFSDKLDNDDKLQEAVEEINTKWSNYRVTKEKCLETLNSLLEVTQNANAELEKVILPEAMIESLGDEEIPEDGCTVAEYIDLFINQAIAGVQNAPIANPSYQAYLAHIQIKVAEILNYHYATYTSRNLISEEQVALYNELGYSLYEQLRKTQMRPDEEDKDMVSVDALRKEITRLQGVYSEYRTQVEQLAKNFADINQNSVSNSLTNYLNTKYSEFEKDLSTMLTEIKDIQGSAFDLNNPVTAAQNKVKYIIENLKQSQNGVFLKTVEIVTTKSTVDKEGTFTEAEKDEDGKILKRSYIETNLRAPENEKLQKQEKFREIMTSLDELTEAYSEVTKFNKDNINITPANRSQNSLGFFGDGRSYGGDEISEDYRSDYGSNL